MRWLIAAPFVALALMIIYDLLQRKHAILHNFPVLGHFRYWLESIGPELRQYIVTSNNEERPFSRDQRSWVYASSKKQNNYFGFGTDNDFESSPHYLIIRHSAFPLGEPSHDSEDYDGLYKIPCAKVLGGYRQRKKAFTPESVVNISAMSFGSLSAPAVEALNRGAKLAGCMHNTGEGGVSPHHQHGGELVLQIGTGYFGCRDERGRFDLKKFIDVVEANPIRAIEIKLSQGAKPGRGGVLPSSKITEEISAIRGVPRGRDCISPASHVEFQCADSMLDFVEMLASESGLPVGIKSAVGQMDFWRDLCNLMANDTRAVDFVAIDGGEGGTGAAPLVFSDHVALPFNVGMSSVYIEFLEADLEDKVVFVGSGKLGFPQSGMFAFGLGCDMINIGREAMLAIGCIQALKCHTGHCPTGIATQNRWLMSGLDPNHKTDRLANYVVTLRKELLQLSHACGVAHPSQVTTDMFEVLRDGSVGVSATKYFGYPQTNEPS
jgi:glutamate synthase (ferredoxin)